MEAAAGRSGGGGEKRGGYAGGGGDGPELLLALEAADDGRRRGGGDGGEKRRDAVGRSGDEKRVRDAVGRSGGGGDGGEKLGEGEHTAEPALDAKRCYNLKDWTTVRDLKDTIRPFQAQLAKVEMQKSNNRTLQMKLEELLILKRRDIEINDHHSEFWPRALTLAPGLKEHYLTADKQMFEEVISVQVIENDSAIIIQFDLKPNIYFENTIFIKSYPLGDNTDQVLGTKVIWKTTMDPSEWLGHRKSFFEWFSDTTAFQDDVIGQEIVRLYREPLHDVLSDEDDWVGRDSEVTQGDQSNAWLLLDGGGAGTVVGGV